MASKFFRPLLAVVLIVSTPAHRVFADEPPDSPVAIASPTPTENSVSGVAVRPDIDSRWHLDFEYSLVDDPPPVLFRIEVVSADGIPMFSPLLRSAVPQTGTHHVETAFSYAKPGRSTQIRVAIVTTEGKVLAMNSVDRVIDWPTQEERDLEAAYYQIDNGSRSSLQQARTTLERLLGKNPMLDDAYIELARIAMKTNWGAEGLHQAETLLDSALQLRPDNANAKILLGYVYAHQDRFEDAAALFVAAARADPPNDWLWTNWGELLEMQGDPTQAIVKYRDAVTGAMGSRKNHPARETAYSSILRLLKERDDVDGMEAVHKQRMDEFGPSACDNAEYARFRLTERQDPKGAVDVARASLGPNCENARQILGLASYVQWAAGSGAESVVALNQARVYLAAGPTAFRLLASSDTTVPAAKKLIAAGEAIDQKDNEQMTALALALRMNDLDAAERLLALGAGPETPVGAQGLPVAFLPVLDGNVDAIRVMQRAGVDYSKLRYRGATALDFAEQTGQDGLIRALTPEERPLL